MWTDPPEEPGAEPESSGSGPRRFLLSSRRRLVLMVAAGVAVSLLALVGLIRLTGDRGATRRIVTTGHGPTPLPTPSTDNSPAPEPSGATSSPGATPVQTQRPAGL